MTEDDVVDFVRSHLEGLFPRVCPHCGRWFLSLREYLEMTTHLDSPIEDADIGAISLALCRCPFSTYRKMKFSSARTGFMRHLTAVA